jgi:hypothetical protein
MHVFVGLVCIVMGVLVFRMRDKNVRDLVRPRPGDLFAYNRSSRRFSETEIAVFKAWFAFGGFVFALLGLLILLQITPLP